MITETDRYGEPLKPVTVEEVVKDLEALPADFVIAVCAALIVTHEPFTWGDKLKLFIGEVNATQA